MLNKLAAISRETALGRFLIPVGLILAVFGVFLMHHANNTKTYFMTEAVISKAELLPKEPDEDQDQADQYDVTVKYTVNGQVYEEYLGPLSGCREGDTIRIAYDPNDPVKITQPGSAVLSIVFIAAGILAFLGGIASLVRSMSKMKRMKKQEEEWVYAG